jgi:hypothetical protein
VSEMKGVDGNINSSWDNVRFSIKLMKKSAYLLWEISSNS